MNYLCTLFCKSKKGLENKQEKELVPEVSRVKGTGKEIERRPPCGRRKTRRICCHRGKEEKHFKKQGDANFPEISKKSIVMRIETN